MKSLIAAVLVAMTLAGCVAVPYYSEPAERVKNFETPVEGNLVSYAGAPLEPSALALVN